MTNEDVVYAWRNGIGPAKTISGNLHTDGFDLYSYDTLIGKHTMDGPVTIEVSISTTTSRHISLAKKAIADKR